MCVLCLKFWQRYITESWGTGSWYCARLWGTTLQRRYLSTYSVCNCRALYINSTVHTVHAGHTLAMTESREWVRQTKLADVPGPNSTDYSDLHRLAYLSCFVNLVETQSGVKVSTSWRVLRTGDSRVDKRRNTAYVKRGAVHEKRSEIFIP